jgi:hypothetical protein
MIEQQKNKTAEELQEYVYELINNLSDADFTADDAVELLFKSFVTIMLARVIASNDTPDSRKACFEKSMDLLNERARTVFERASK